MNAVRQKFMRNGGPLARKIVAGVVAGLVIVGLGTAPAQAQVAWDGPFLISPASPTGWGVYLVDPAPGSTIGVMSSWRGTGPIGYRVGLAEDEGENLSVYGGVDISGALIRASDEFPIDVHWLTGAGFGVGDIFLISVPVGLSVGREMQAEGVWFNPYVAPRVVLDAYLGGEGPDEGLELDLAFDLGLDLSFDPGWAIRFAASLGDRKAIAIGVSFRIL